MKWVYKSVGVTLHFTYLMLLLIPPHTQNQHRAGQLCSSRWDCAANFNPCTQPKSESLSLKLGLVITSLTTCFCEWISFHAALTNSMEANCPRGTFKGYQYIWCAVAKILMWLSFHEWSSWANNRWAVEDMFLRWTSGNASSRIYLHSCWNWVEENIGIDASGPRQSN